MRQIFVLHLRVFLIGVMRKLKRLIDHMATMYILLNKFYLECLN